jgi:hypothetical protein
MFRFYNGMSLDGSGFSLVYYGRKSIQFIVITNGTCVPLIKISNEILFNVKKIKIKKQINKKIKSGLLLVNHPNRPLGWPSQKK